MTRWTLKEFTKLWHQCRVIDNWARTDVQDAHAYVLGILNQVDSVRAERDRYKERACIAESRLDEITSALAAHAEEKANR